MLYKWLKLRTGIKQDKKKKKPSVEEICFKTWKAECQCLRGTWGLALGFGTSTLISLISQDTCCCYWPIPSPARGVLRARTYSVHFLGHRPKLPSKASWVWLTSNLIWLTVHDGSCSPLVHAEGYDAAEMLRDLTLQQDFTTT